MWDTASGALAVAGALTAGNVDLLRDSVEERLPRLRGLRVDCAGVTECDPTGLAVLLTLRRCADALGIGFHMAASSVPARFLELTGTDEYLTGPRSSQAIEEGVSGRHLRPA